MKRSPKLLREAIQEIIVSARHDVIVIMGPREAKALLRELERLKKIEADVTRERAQWGVRLNSVACKFCDRKIGKLNAKKAKAGK